jgi:hypothetical protein
MWREAGRTWTAVSIGNTNRTHTLTGLRNGYTVEVKVAAVNAAGTGPWSSVAEVVPAAVPRAVVAQPGKRSALVQWAAPLNPGPTAVSSYVVTAAPGGQTCRAKAPRLRCTVEGLTNGTAYTFTVKAKTNGWSGPSAPSAAVTPRASITVPGAPRRLEVASNRNGSATLAWVAPKEDGGSAVLGYRVRYKRVGADEWTRITPSVDARTYAISGLKKGKDYSFKVRAANIKGAGDAVIVRGVRAR